MTYKRTFFTLSTSHRHTVWSHASRYGAIKYFYYYNYNCASQARIRQRQTISCVIITNQLNMLCILRKQTSSAVTDLTTAAAASTLNNVIHCITLNFSILPSSISAHCYNRSTVLGTVLLTIVNKANIFVRGLVLLLAFKTINGPVIFR